MQAPKTAAPSLPHVAGITFAILAVMWLTFPPQVNDQAQNGLTELSARAFDAAENQGDSEPVEFGVALPPPGELVWEADLEAGAVIEDLATPG